ncbi:hypothetical protein, partial [uncultured Maricaulis sp.]|uniref:hypothetical protein n=1 Tax=uncultured Maricaulis sp. TaxID=174710 RepID=UPI0030DA016A
MGDEQGRLRGCNLGPNLASLIRIVANRYPARRNLCIAQAILEITCRNPQCLHFVLWRALFYGVPWSLRFTHDYYQYSNGMFLLVAGAIARAVVSQDVAQQVVEPFGWRLLGESLVRSGGIVSIEV